MEVFPIIYVELAMIVREFTQVKRGKDFVYGGFTAQVISPHDKTADQQLPEVRVQLSRCKSSTA